MACRPQAGTFTTTCPGRNATVRETAVGTYQVRFPCTASSRGIVHVTALDDVGQYCSPRRWANTSGDLTVTVFCYGAGELPSRSRFTVLYTTSSGAPSGGGRYAYVHATAAGGIVSTYNGEGVANTVTRQATGRYLVRIASRSGGKYNGTMDWDSSGGAEFVTVGCWEGSERAGDSPFTLSFSDRRSVTGAASAYFAYLWSEPGVPTESSYSSVGGETIAEPGGAVVFTGIGHPSTHLQVTGFGYDTTYCQPISEWVTGSFDIVAKHVACYRGPWHGTDGTFFAAAVSSA